MIVVFLLAVQVWLTLWSEVGGQYHLDIMFWPWKLGLTAAAAGLVTAITANLLRGEGEVTRRAVVYGALLFAVMVVAGVVTYYYHMNEPPDDDSGDDQPTATEMIRPLSTRPGTRLPVPSVYRPGN